MTTPVEALVDFFVNVRNTHDVSPSRIAEVYANAITTLAEELDIDITADGDTLEMELREVFRTKRVVRSEEVVQALAEAQGKCFGTTAQCTYIAEKLTDK